MNKPLGDNENLILGRNSVKEALRSGRELESIYVAQGAEDGSMRQILAMARDSGVIVKSVPTKKLDMISLPFGYEGKPANHQGVAAVASAIKYAEMEDIFRLAEQRKEKPFVIALDGIEDPHNVGAIVRSAEFFGAHGIILTKRRSCGMTLAACKSASGAEEFIPIVREANLVRTLEGLKKRGVWIAAADMDGQNADQSDLTGSLCIVIGAEGAGVSRLVKETCDFVVKIERTGSIESLNASCAAAVLFYERSRQAREKG